MFEASGSDKLSVCANTETAKNTDNVKIAKLIFFIYLPPFIYFASEVLLDELPLLFSESPKSASFNAYPS